MFPGFGENSSPSRTSDERVNPDIFCTEKLFVLCLAFLFCRCDVAQEEQRASASVGLALILRSSYSSILEDIVVMVSLCCRLLIRFVCGACTGCMEATLGCYTVLVIIRLRLVEALGALCYYTYYANTMIEKSDMVCRLRTPIMLCFVCTVRTTTVSSININSRACSSSFFRRSSV